MLCGDDALPVLEILALIEGLPEDSAYVGSVRDSIVADPDYKPSVEQRPSFRGWTRLHTLLADRYDQAEVQFLAEFPKKDRPEFTPWPRPAVREAVKPGGYVSSLKKRFGLMTKGG